jgi:hypothetical protein
MGPLLAFIPVMWSTARCCSDSSCEYGVLWGLFWTPSFFPVPCYALQARADCVRPSRVPTSHTNNMINFRHNYKMSGMKFKPSHVQL